MSADTGFYSIIEHAGKAEARVSATPTHTVAREIGPGPRATDS
ncbi:hypothetical protein [Amycolatopsis sp. YIM 10]|nr:hypothetical protein [Amycolatopsis sp. YIM 10]